MNDLTPRARILGGLWGALVGDALGVPVEFTPREIIRVNPVTGMRGFGTHHQPLGTWSDDGALTLCTVDSLLRAEFDPQNMGELFSEWMRNGLWAATGEVFDIGVTTANALRRIANGTKATEAGGRSENSNGNGSLMRILPVALRFAAAPERLLIERVSIASRITHAHRRSQMACGLYALIVRRLLNGCSPLDALQSARSDFLEHCKPSRELHAFQALLTDDLSLRTEGSIRSGGYVLDTLTASLWCLLTTSSFRDCVLQAVNLGEDSDTTGCVSGGLAGVCYGQESIPTEWLDAVRHREVEELFGRFAELCVESYEIR